ncbi:MAG: CDP-diacylglycerol--glycerol-3-phosphate 3-phosphatidyltransferase [Luteolibacter sp.]
MTLATKVTVARILLIPVFAFYAISYGISVKNLDPVEESRWIALAIFILAAASDGLDGWIARRFNQKSKLGAFLDPIADKLLVTTALIILTVLDWGAYGWSIPLWFTVLVLARDSIILAGIRYLNFKNCKVIIKPHWSGKVCTVSLFVVLGWVMLKAIPLSPAYPCVIATIFTLWSMLEYIGQGLRMLGERNHDATS